MWRVRASGGEPERIAGIAENAADPAFSRDGRMAYAQFFMDTNIWRIETESKQAPVKVISSTQYDSSPQYSPDGSRVAFRSNRSGSNEIWVSDSNGRIPVQLTKYGGPLTGTPRWSPDGMNIAFDTQARRPGGYLCGLLDRSRTPRRVTRSEAEDVVPSWSSDGAWIYFASNRTGAWQVWRAPSSGGLEEQVTRNGGFAAFESPDGQYLYYAKGRSASGLWRKRLPSGTEEVVLEQLKPGYWGYWAVVENGIYFADQTAFQRFWQHLVLRFRHAECEVGIPRGQAVHGRRFGFCGFTGPSVHLVHAGGSERQRHLHTRSATMKAGGCITRPERVK